METSWLSFLRRRVKMNASWPARICLPRDTVRRTWCRTIIHAGCWDINWAKVIPPFITEEFVVKVSWLSGWRGDFENHTRSRSHPRPWIAVSTGSWFAPDFSVVRRGSEHCTLMWAACSLLFRKRLFQADRGVGNAFHDRLHRCSEHHRRIIFRDGRFLSQTVRVPRLLRRLWRTNGQVILSFHRNQTAQKCALFSVFAHLQPTAQIVSMHARKNGVEVWEPVSICLTLRIWVPTTSNTSASGQKVKRACSRQATRVWLHSPSPWSFCTATQK